MWVNIWWYSGCRWKTVGTYFALLCLITAYITVICTYSICGFWLLIFCLCFINIFLEFLNLWGSTWWQQDPIQVILQADRKPWLQCFSQQAWLFSVKLTASIDLGCIGEQRTYFCQAKTDVCFWKMSRRLLGVKHPQIQNFKRYNNLFIYCDEHSLDDRVVCSPISSRTG